MKHFTRISDLGPEGVMEILATAAEWKRNRPGALFADRILGMVFFNPSLRTRASFEIAGPPGNGNNPEGQRRKQASQRWRHRIVMKPPNQRFARQESCKRSNDVSPGSVRVDY